MPNVKVVFGAPGTGKTSFIIAHISERLNQLGGKDFTYVTFTKAASADFKDRLMKQFKMEKDEVKELMVGTQHAICYRLIGTQRKVTDEKDKIAFCEKLKIEYTPSHAIPVDDIQIGGGEIDENLPIGNKAFAIDQQCRMRMSPPTNLEIDEIFLGVFGLKQLENFMQEWKNYRRAVDKVDFTDMLEIVLENKLTPNTKRGYFDEFQDYGALQYAVYQLWRDAMEEVVVAGDDDQCIFGYSGASPKFLLQEKGERIILGTNHRNSKEIYDVGLQLIKRNLTRVEKKITCINPKTGAVERVDFWSDGVEGLRRYLLPNERTFILVRTNRQLKEVCDVFDNQLIPYSCLRVGTPWTQSFLSLLSALRKVNLDKKAKLTPDELHALVEELPQKDYIIWGKKQELMKKFDDISFEDLQHMYLKSSTQDTLNVKHGTVEIKLASLTEARIAMIKSKRQRGIARQLHGLSYPMLNTNYDIYIGTMHSSKGLEADKVILSDALPKKIVDSLEGKITEEERRVYYVAITRARTHLVFAYNLFENTEPFMR